MRSFKKFILLLIIALNAAGSFAQNQKTDFDIANEYYDAGKYEEAINYYERSLQFDIKKYGANHIYIGIDYFFIGLSYLRLEKYNDSIENFNKALNIYDSKKLIGNKEELSKFKFDVLYHIAIDYKFQGKWNNALDYYRKALPLCLEVYGEFHKETAILHECLGYVNLALNNTDDSIQSYLTALKIYKNINASDKVIADCLVSLSYVYILLKNDLPTALANFKTAEDIYNKILPADSLEFAFLYGKFAVYYKRAYDFHKAIDFTDKAVSIFDKHYGVNNSYSMPLLVELGECYSLLGDKAKELAVLLRCEEYYTTHPHANLIFLLLDISSCYFYMLDYQNAILYGQKAIDLYKEYYGNKVIPWLAFSYSCMGSIYKMMGLYNSYEYYENALSWYKKELDVWHELKKDDCSSAMLANTSIADIYVKFGRYSEAENLLIDICKKASELGYADVECSSYRDLENIYAYYNINKEKAIECWRKDLEISKNKNSPLHKTESDFMMQTFYQKAADSFFASETDLMRELISFCSSETELVILDMPSSKFTLLQEIIPLYYYGIGLESESNNPEKSFEYSERLRNCSFLDQVGTARALSLDGVTDSERKEIERLANEIAILRKTIEYEYSKKFSEYEKNGTAENDLRNAEKQLAKLDSEIGKRIPAYSALRNPQIAKAKDAQKWCGKDKAIVEYAIWNPKILDEVKYIKNLDSQNWVGTQNYDARKSAENIKFGSYCIVITNKKITVVPLDVDYDYVAAVSKLRDGIIPKRISPQLETVFEDVRNELYEKLIEPVLPYVKGKNNLVVVPDGSLAFLPFDVLRKDENSKMLCEQFAVSLSPSVSVSMVSKSSKTNGNKMLAFGGAWYDSSLSSDEHRRTFSFEDKDRGGKRGFQSLETEMLIENQQQKEAIIQDIKLNGPSSYFEKKNLHWKDLPGTLTELNCLQKIFKSKDFSEFVQENASESKLKELSKNDELKNFSILHFACHGYFDRQISDMSSILFSEVSGKLSASSSNDGYLTIPEVSTLNLNADIVCLSACETGLGEVKFGDGMTGLSRAFMVAGAKHVGVTLWSVDDEATSEFMSKMYKKISSGKTYEQAYRQTKAEFMKSEDFSHPYYWAAFALYE